MGLFGGSGKDDEAADMAALQATRDRLEAMGLDDLGEELLRGTFGPGTPGEGHLVPTPEILKPYDPTGSGHFAGMPPELWTAVTWVVEEGLQHLEHRGLVIRSLSGSGTYESFRATRSGRAHLGR